MPLQPNVRQIRLEMGLTQDQLANISGVHRVTIAGIESGKVAPNGETIFRLARALQVTVEDLFTYVEEKPSLSKRIIAEASGAARGVVVSAIVMIALFFGVAIFNDMRGDAALEHGDYQTAQMDHFVSSFMLHPLVTHARMAALEASEPLNVGETRGYLSRLPAVADCRAWLNRYDTLAQESPIDDVFGRPLHEALADCLDRVNASELAYTERVKLVTHPSFILARSAPMDAFLIMDQAVDAQLMGDAANAQRLYQLAKTMHPAFLKRYATLWNRPHTTIEFQIMRGIANASPH